MYQLTTVARNDGSVLYFNDYNEAYVKQMRNSNCMSSLFYARKSLCQTYECTKQTEGGETVSFESV